MSDDLPQGEHAAITIIGAGFSGIALAVELERAGFDDVVLLERQDGVGGVWRANAYPGCACDVPSALYSYSWAPNPDWGRVYGTQPEILAYLERVAGERGVAARVRFGCELTGADWDDDARRWRLETTAGLRTTDVLLCATGLFGDATIPDLPGLERFAGTTFHSLHWDHDHDLRGERVAVIGTGASAVQFVPAIQPEVAHLTVFQRTPPWIMPRLDHETSSLERLAMRRVPGLRRAARLGIYAFIEGLGLPAFVDRRFRHGYEAIGRLHLRRQVPDPELRRRLTPDYAIGCKRAILSDAYLPALTAPNVAVVTDPIAEVTEHAVRTADGTEHEVDAIVFGTGFVTPSRADRVVRGRDGRSIIDRYDERPQSHLGVAMAGFPNCFFTLGPFGAAGNQSAVYMIERQARYVADALRTMRERGADVVEVRPEAQEAYVAEAERRSEGTVWLEGGCRSYYQTPDGRNAGLWPGWSFEYARRVRRFEPDEYELTGAAG